MDCRIVPFGRTTLCPLLRAQQPFEIIGRLLPSYDGEKWTTTELLFAEKKEKTYPDDSFDPMEYVENPEKAAFLAMLGEECAGSIRVCRRWNGNALIEDLAVDRAFRRHGVGTMLMDAAVRWGKEKGFNGVSLETQDNNLAACRFYLQYGFELGGIDAKVYARPSYRGETALYFYLSDAAYQTKEARIQDRLKTPGAAGEDMRGM